MKPISPFSGLEIEPRAFTPNHILAACLFTYLFIYLIYLLIYFWAKASLSKLSRLCSDLASFCLSPTECRNYRCVSLCLALFLTSKSFATSVSFLISTNMSMKANKATYIILIIEKHKIHRHDHYFIFFHIYPVRGEISLTKFNFGENNDPNHSYADQIKHLKLSDGLSDGSLQQIQEKYFKGKC